MANKSGGYSMEFRNSVPESEINTNRLRQVMTINNMPLLFEITDIYVTEPFKPFNPVNSYSRYKKNKADLTVSGIIKSKYMVNRNYVFNICDTGISNNEFNLSVDDGMDEDLRSIEYEVMNITFPNIRLNYRNDFYVDSKHMFYQDYLKPILVNDGYMDGACNDDVIMKMGELKRLFRNKKILLEPVKVDDLNKKWMSIINKGDNDGE